MLDDEFNTRRARLVRELADRSDPFTRKRLLELASRYETGPVKIKPLPVIAIDGQDRPVDDNGGGETG